MRLLRPVAIGALALGLAVTMGLGLVTACADSASDSASSPGATPATTAVPRLHVVATTAIVGDVARAVLGERGDVTVLAGPGTDPRTATVAPPDQAALDQADVVVTVRAGYERALQPAVDAARAQGTTVYEVLPTLSPTLDDAGQPDVHVWLDPDRLSAMADQLSGELFQRSGQDDRGPWHDDEQRFAATMATADEAAQAALDPLPDDRRVLVTTSPGLGYLAARYGLTIRAPRAGEPTLELEVDTLATAPPGPTTDAELLVQTARRIATWLQRTAPGTAGT